VNRLLALAASAAATATAQTSTATAQTYFVAPDGADTSGSCTANTASNAFPTIQDALACAVSGDTISLAPTGSTPYPGFGTVSQNITISPASGAIARTVAVDETTAALTVGAGATVKLTGVTLNGGSNPAAPDVTNHGVLTLTRDSITASPATGGIENSSAGASAARLTLNGTTVSGNVGTQSGAGVTSVTGTGTGAVSLTVENSTIAGNNAVEGEVGGVYTGLGTTAKFINATITGNQGEGSGTTGGLFTAAGAGAVVLSNTIIGGNAGGGNPDCSGHLADGPGGHNLIGNIGTGTGTGACSGLTNGVNGDQVSVPAGLLPLASNGGPTNTAALAPSSPAIAAGDPTTCAQAPISGKDQRGHKRKASSHGSCDIGAYDTGGKPVTVHTYFVAPNDTDQRGHSRNATTRGGCDIGAYDTGGAS
jgi:hypothetical protein